MKTIKNYNEYVNETYNDTISDLIKFKDELNDTIIDYLEEMDLFSEEVYLIINRITLNVSYGPLSDDEENDYYPIKDCITEEDDEYVPISDIINDIASRYIFVR
ncbi:MAG: hypothetical protein M0R46_10330 [Candidatus Muirbacterium halophilum]|nr:hypothetical protein [Candidatus Muirbacterium halophilum]